MDKLDNTRHCPMCEDAAKKILELEQRVKVLTDAIRPFMLIINTSEGRIPTERLSFANWHELIKAYNQSPQQTDEQIERWHIEWMTKLPVAGYKDAIYGDFSRVNRIGWDLLVAIPPSPKDDDS